MNSFSQWAHQHDFLLVLTLTLGASFGLLVRYRRRSVRWWAAWGVALGSSVVAVVALRTPSASLSEYKIATGTTDPAVPARVTQVTQFLSEELLLTSVEDVRSLLACGGKYTLMEIYADYGFS